MEVSESIVINNNIKNVFEAFRNIKQWETILDDVASVNVLYDDGFNQEFEMTVLRPVGDETIRGVRYCKPYNQLILFQPLPPPNFKKMIGHWFFKENEGTTTVVALRKFEVNELFYKNKEKAYVESSEILRSFLKKNLNSFKNYLENNEN